MQHALFSLVFATSAALGTQGFADVTPDEVWQDFRSYLETFGYSVTARETGSGDALVVTDVIVRMDLPEDEGAVSIDMGTMRFTRAGDGVDIGFDEVMPVRFDLTPRGARSSAGTLEYRQDALRMRATEFGDGLSYSYGADALSLALTELIVDGETLGRDVARIELDLGDVRGQTDMTGGALRDLTQTFAAARVGYDMFFTDTDGSGDVAQLRGEITDLRADGTSKLPRDMSGQDFRTMAEAGFETVSRAVHSGGTLELNVTQDGEIAAMSSSSGGGEYSITMDATSVGYGVTSTDVALRMFGQQLPVPIEIDAATIGATISGPAIETEEPEDFDMRLTFGDVVMSELLWTMFDPAKQLPRDPATLAVDLSGKARMLMDIFDPAPGIAMQRDGLPAELSSLALNNLTLDAAGAKLTGEGAFTFDNSDTETFRGMPRPMGEINLQLSGANQLIETLVAMGILPEEQAMGARMMMAMFAQPVGDDELSSKIEINEAGHVLANGQRIQ